MAQRASVPEPPERPEMPIDIPVVLRRGAGYREMETDYGTRPAYGVHVYVFDGNQGVSYLGHINVFWTAALGQLQEGIGSNDEVLMATKVVQNGRRYELQGIQDPDLTNRLYDATEALMANDDTSDSQEDNASFA